MRVSGAHVCVDFGAALEVDDRVVPRRQPHHRGGSGAAQRIRWQPGVFECFPGDFEQHPLLGVHRLCFARSDAEEVGVEPGDVVDEAPPFRRHPSRCLRVGVVEGVRVPAIGGHHVDGVAPLHQQLPKAVRPGHTARQPATDAHHRHRFGDVGGKRRPRAHKFACEDLARLR